MGATAEDIITGFKGVVTGKCSYITGCDQYLIQPRAENNIKIDAQWFDINRLVSDERISILKLDNSVDKGACDMAPVK